MYRDGGPVGAARSLSRCIAVAARKKGRHHKWCLTSGWSVALQGDEGRDGMPKGRHKLRPSPTIFGGLKWTIQSWSLFLTRKIISRFF